jgi:hypothetical protein
MAASHGDTAMHVYLAVLQATCVQGAREESGWSILSSLATGAATIVALGLGLYQWSKDRKHQSDVRNALATALFTDLKTWQTVLEQQRRQFDEKALPSEAAYKAWVHRLRAPMLPTFERFYLMLPDLGQRVSTPVVRAYAEAMRLGELINSETGRPDMTDRAYVQLAADIHPHLQPNVDRIGVAMTALLPYAKDPT